MRSQGQVRFVRISSRLQMLGLTIAAFAALLWVGTLAGMLAAELLSGPGRSASVVREARVATADNRLAAYRKEVGVLADDLAARQAFLEKVVDSQLGELPAEDAKAGDAGKGPTGTEATARKVSTLIPEAAGLAELEARQFAFVARLTAAADQRVRAAERRIRMAGLDPRKVLASGRAHSAQGGPLIPLVRGAMDPRFELLGASLARMDALERGMTGIPSVLPASLAYVSSGFGYRSDPFTGTPALHSGLDFRGPLGAPIYAAARGRVIAAGFNAGYGNAVEVDHGNGLVTRYAHMSSIRAHVGQMVEAGGVIGAIGSTGRSTGPHLHFEVRLNGSAVNPRPFLEASRNVQK